MRETLTAPAFRKVANNLHKALLEADDRARKEIRGYTGHQFRSMLAERHGYHVAKELLRRLPSGRVQSGFADLIVAGRPDLTMEAVVLERRWSRLFNQHEIAEATRRFRLVGYNVSYLLTPGEVTLVIKRDRPLAAA